MNPTETPMSNDDKLQNVHNPLKVMQDGERVICEVRRHPIGLIGVYLISGFIACAAIAAAIAAPILLPDITSQVKTGLAFGVLIVLAFVLLSTYIAHVVYTGNRWIVTTDSLTQVSQISLFRSQTSQLSLANLEDVSVTQDGIVQSIVGYGTLKVETAGEHSKFTFPFCPKPNQCAKEIIAAHEAYIAENPAETYTSNRSLANTAALNQSYTPPQPQAQAGYNPAAPQAYQPPQPTQNQQPPAPQA